MASVEKLILKMRNQPNGIRKEEMHKVLTEIGYELRDTEGSHRQYKKRGNKRFTLVWESPVKAYLVRELLKIIDEE